MDTKRFSGHLFARGQFSGVEDVLPVEEALQITVNDIPFTVTMRSPGNEKELIRGLLFTEGITGEVVPGFEPVVRERNLSGEITVMDVRIPEEYLLRDFSGMRNVASSSSCGLCGKVSFEEEITSTARQFKLHPDLIGGYFDQVVVHQSAFNASGGTHASGAFSRSGQLLLVMEDIGRHNAVDKIIGGLLLNGRLQEVDCITVSGRVSYEIVSKVMKAGIPVLAAVSAPSSKAVETAAAAGITLLAFCRSEKFTVYTHPHRVEMNPVADVKL